MAFFFASEIARGSSSVIGGMADAGIVGFAFGVDSPSWSSSSSLGAASAGVVSSCLVEGSSIEFGPGLGSSEGVLRPVKKLSLIHI